MTITERIDALPVHSTADLTTLVGELRKEADLTGCPISKALMVRAADEIERLAPSEAAEACGSICYCGQHRCELPVGHVALMCSSGVAFSWQRIERPRGVAS